MKSCIKLMLIGILVLSLLACEEEQKKRKMRTEELEISNHFDTSYFDMRYNGYVFFDGVFYNKVNKASAIMIEAKPDIIVDTIKAHLIFDTGADGATFDSLFYKNSKFSYHTTEIEYGGVGEGTQKAQRIIDPVNFSFNGTYLSSELSIVGDIRSGAGSLVDGIIGHEFFKGQAILIDYKNSLVKILDGKNFKATADYIALPLVYRNNRYFVKVSLNVSESSKVEGDCLLDLGFPGTIMLTSQTVRKHNLETTLSRKVNYFSKWEGAGGKTSGFYCRASSLKLGPYELKDLGMACSKDAKGAMADIDYIALLGNGILDRFDIGIDFYHSILYLKPNSRFKDKFITNRTGCGYSDRTDICNGWIIRQMMERSNAEKLGIKIGDIVTHLNEKPIKEMSYKEVGKAFRELDKVMLTILRNNKKLKFELELQEYY